MPSELEEKLSRIRKLLSQRRMDALHLTQGGNLAWLLCGGDTLVSLVDPPVAQALVTEDGARLFVPEFERDRLEAEEVPEGVQVSYLPWENAEAFTEARLGLADPTKTLSDAPSPGTNYCNIWNLRTPLLEAEVARYRGLGQDAARAVGRAMRRLEPGWSENRTAGEVAAELRTAGIQPALLLVGGDGRLKRFRHPTPSSEPARHRVMVVVCARRHGLYANLTRLAAFTPLGPQEARRYRAVLEIEAAAFAATRHGRFYRDVMQALQQAYADHRQPLAWRYHHQGGATGYFTRDFLATPAEDKVITDGTAFAWNPSLPGLKVEDTVLLGHGGLEVLTRDPEWPTTLVEGVERPDFLLLG